MGKTLGKLYPRAPGLYSHAYSISTEAKFWLPVDGLSQILRSPHSTGGSQAMGTRLACQDHFRRPSTQPRTQGLISAHRRVHAGHVSPKNGAGGGGN